MFRKFGVVKESRRFASIPIALVCAALCSAQDTGEESPWYERSIVGIEVGPTGAQFGNSDLKDITYCKLWDGKEIVRESVEANAEYLVLWLRDGDYAYYNSELLPKAPGLGDRDPLADAMEEAHEHNLPIISYCVVQQAGHFLAEHPEWQMVGSDGNKIGRFCFNSGYLEAMKQIVKEQLDYGIDGFHIDMLDQGFGPPYGCWCPSCQGKFREQFGHDMPEGATWDESWDDMLTFRYQTSERFERELTAFIKSVRADATVDYNYHGNPPFSFEVGQRPVQHAGNGDFVTGETGIWGFSALGVGLNAEFYRASTPGKPFQVAIQRGVRMYHDQTTRPLNDIRWELMTLLAHGAFVTMVDKTGFDGALDPVAYERIGSAFKECRDKRDHFGHEPVYDVGLYFSSRTRDWYAREEPGKYFRSFQGAHRVCSMEHLQYGVILDENISQESLAKYPVVVVPNATILSDRELTLLTTYVREGGQLIVTGITGQLDRVGSPLEERTIEELIGARVNSELGSLDNWVSLPSSSRDDSGSDVRVDRLGNGIRADWPFLVKGPATIYEPTTAKPMGALYRPHRTLRQLDGRMGTDWPMSADVRVGPAALLNQVGEGRVLTIAASPDYATASEHAVVEARTLLANAIRMLHPRPRIHVKAPANVEAVVMDDPETRTMRVHLIAYNPTPQTTPARNRPHVLPGLVEDEPIFRVTIACDFEVASVVALNEQTQVSHEPTQVSCLVEDIHEVIVIQY